MTLTFRKYTVTALWLHTLWKSMSTASLSAKTLRWSAHLLSSFLQWLRYVVLKYNLLSCSLLPTLLHQSWSTPMRSSSSIIYRKSLKPSAPPALVFSRPRNRISSVWPLELLVFSIPLQWFMYWLIMVHLTTVRATLGMTNSQVWWCEYRRLVLTVIWPHSEIQVV